MADVWEKLLVPASLDGIAFPIQRRGIEGGWDYARALYQNVEAQDLEVLGRRARRFELVVELFADIDESHYPGLYKQLHAMLVDTGKSGIVEYIDPVWGPLPIGIMDWRIEEEATKRDGATFILRVEERTVEKVQIAAPAFVDPRGLARNLASELDDTLAGIGLPALSAAMADIGFPLTPDEAAGFPELMLTLVDNAFASMDDVSNGLEDVAYEVDRYRSRVDRILRFDPMREAASWSAFYAAMQLAATVTAVGKAIGIGTSDANAGPQITTYEVIDNMMAEQVSLELYGTAAKAGRIRQLNPSRLPFYAGGTTLKVDAVTS